MPIDRFLVTVSVTLQDEPETMRTAELQTEIVQMIKDESDTSILEAIRILLYRVRQGRVDDDFTAEDLAELDRRRAEYLRGEGTSYTAEESLQRLRSGKR